MLSLLIVQSHKSIKTWTKTTWDLITKKGIKHKKQSTIIKVNSTHSKSRTWIPMQNRYAQKENCADDFPIYKWFSHSYVWLPEDTWKTAKISLSKHRPSQNPLVNRNVLHQTKKQCLFSIPCYSNTSPLGLPSTVGFSGKITIVHSKNPQVSCLNQRNPSSLQLKSHEISHFSRWNPQFSPQAQLPKTHTLAARTSTPAETSWQPPLHGATTFHVHHDTATWERCHFLGVYIDEYTISRMYVFNTVCIYVRTYVRMLYVCMYVM